MGTHLNNDLIVETKGYCFLCLDQILPQFSFPSTNNQDVSVKSEIINGETISPVYYSSLQCLARFLKMDVRKVLVQEGPTPSQLLIIKVEEPKLKVELCEECISINARFSGLYRQLEKTQMELSSSLKPILSKLGKALGIEMTEGFQTFTGNEEGLNTDKLQVVEELRKEALQKCTKKLKSSVPNVRIQNLAMQNGKRKKRKKLTCQRTDDDMQRFVDMRSIKSEGVILQEPGSFSGAESEHGIDIGAVKMAPPASALNGAILSTEENLEGLDNFNGDVSDDDSWSGISSEREASKMVCPTLPLEQPKTGKDNASAKTEQASEQEDRPKSVRKMRMRRRNVNSNTSPQTRTRASKSTKSSQSETFLANRKSRKSVRKTWSKKRKVNSMPSSPENLRSRDLSKLRMSRSSQSSEGHFNHDDDVDNDIGLVEMTPSESVLNSPNLETEEKNEESASGNWDDPWSGMGNEEEASKMDSASQMHDAKLDAKRKYPISARKTPAKKRKVNSATGSRSKTRGFSKSNEVLLPLLIDTEAGIDIEKADDKKEASRKSPKSVRQTRMKKLKVNSTTSVSRRSRASSKVNISRSSQSGRLKDVPLPLVIGNGGRESAASQYIRIHKTGKYKCRHCPREYSFEGGFRTHYVSVHLKVKYRCRACGRQYNYKNQHDNHYLKEHLGVRYSCEECDAVYMESFSLAMHVKYVHLGERFKCDYCPATFSNYYNRGTHMRDKHVQLNGKPNKSRKR